MSTMRPRPPQSQGLRSANHARDKDVEQVRRLLSAKPPTPKAPVVSGGGIVGMAQLISTSGTVLHESGSTDMNYAGVTYGAPTDPNAGNAGVSTIPISSWLDVSGYQITVDPGWYVPVLHMQVIWDDPAAASPAFGGPYTNGGWSAIQNDYGIHAKVPFGSRAGFVQIANYGPVYMPPGSDFHAELRAVGGNPTADSNPLGLYSKITWNIVKLG